MIVFVFKSQLITIAYHQFDLLLFFRRYRNTIHQRLFTHFTVDLINLAKNKILVDFQGKVTYNI